MRSIRRKGEALAVAAALALLGSGGCHGALPAPTPAAHPDDATPRRGGTLRLASFGDVRTLDPAVNADALGSSVIRLVYAGLVDFDVDGKIAPDLATRWDVADGGRTYRFFLREGARFHDGREVTAADVKRSIERALAPTTPGPLASFYEGIDGFDAFAKGAPHLAGVVDEGRYVVAIRLGAPDATFLQFMALTPMRIVCASAGDRYEDGAAPCGAGPFKVAPSAWDHGRSITVTRHDGYFREGLPYLDAVNVLFNVNVLTERFKFERGELDVVRDLTQPDTRRFLADPRWAPFGAYEADRSINGESMNTTMPPFDNVEVRRAVAAAIDRTHLVDLKPSNLRALEGPVPPSLQSATNAPVRGQTYDLEAALAHMARAGYAFDPKTRRGGYPSPIPYVVYKQGLYEFTGQVVQQALAAIGLRLDIRIASYPAYLAVTHRRGASPMSPQGYAQDYPDPRSFLAPFEAGPDGPSEDSNNTAFYASRELDALLAEARRTVDDAARARLYAKAEQIVIDDAPWAFTTSYRFYEVRQPYVRGYRPNAVWPYAVEAAWLDRAADGRSDALSARGLGDALYARAVQTP